METASIHRLRRLNNDFYRSNAVSFSQTRQRPWEGWEKVAECMPADSASVIDVACGNMRFERFLESVRPQVPWSFDCLDACDGLADARYRESYRHLDVLDALEGGLPLALDGRLYDVAVCFGFMHHVPTAPMRQALLGSLLACVREGGIAAVSFWRFAEDEGRLAKARETTARAGLKLGLKLGANDFFLGWNEQRETYRYCHSFTSGEVDELASSVKHEGEVIARFRADGKNSRMNEYIILRRR